MVRMIAVLESRIIIAVKEVLHRVPDKPTVLQWESVIILVTLLNPKFEMFFDFYSGK